MNIWRVKSRTGSTIHLTIDRDKTFCGRSIKDDWKFLFLVNSRVEAMENTENLCMRCNTENLDSWEEEVPEDTIYYEGEEDGTGEEFNEEDVKESEPARADKVRGLGTW